MKTQDKILSVLAVAAMLYGCGGGVKDGSANASANEAADTATIAMREIQVGSKVYNIADIDDSACVYKEATSKERCFLVISKKEYRLYVYEAGGEGQDTLLLAHFPVCYAKYAEAKTKSGDMRTPESTLATPFHIQQIQDASTWHHDFGDGRGSIPSDRYAQTGQAVIIKGIGEGKYPFEERARAALGDRYRGPVAGNKRQSDAPAAASAAESGAVIKRQGSQQ